MCETCGTWKTVIIRCLLRSHEHEAAAVTAEVGVVRRDVDWKAGAIVKTIRLTAVIPAFYVFHFGSKSFHHATHTRSKPPNDKYKLLNM